MIVSFGKQGVESSVGDLGVRALSDRAPIGFIYHFCEFSFISQIVGSAYFENVFLGIGSLWIVDIEDREMITYVPE